MADVIPPCAYYLDFIGGRYYVGGTTRALTDLIAQDGSIVGAVVVDSEGLKINGDPSTGHGSVPIGLIPLSLLPTSFTMIIGWQIDTAVHAEDQVQAVVAIENSGNSKVLAMNFGGPGLIGTGASCQIKTTDDAGTYIACNDVGTANQTAFTIIDATSVTMSVNGSATSTAALTDSIGSSDPLHFRVTAPTGQARHIAFIAIYNYDITGDGDQFPDDMLATYSVPGVAPPNVPIGVLPQAPDGTPAGIFCDFQNGFYWNGSAWVGPNSVLTDPTPVIPGAGFQVANNTNSTTFKAGAILNYLLSENWTCVAEIDASGNGNLLDYEWIAYFLVLDDVAVDEPLSFDVEGFGTSGTNDVGATPFSMILTAVDTDGTNSYQRYPNAGNFGGTFPPPFGPPQCDNQGPGGVYNQTTCRVAITRTNALLATAMSGQLVADDNTAVVTAVPTIAYIGWFNASATPHAVAKLAADASAADGFSAYIRSLAFYPPVTDYRHLQTLSADPAQPEPPAWVPRAPVTFDNAVCHLDFVNGQYWDGIGSRTIEDVLYSPTTPVASNLTPGKGFLAGDSTDTPNIIGNARNVFLTSNYTAVVVWNLNAPNTQDLDQAAFALVNVNNDNVYITSELIASAGVDLVQPEINDGKPQFAGAFGRVAQQFVSPTPSQLKVVQTHLWASLKQDAAGLGVDTVNVPAGRPFFSTQLTHAVIGGFDAGESGTGTAWIASITLYPPQPDLTVFFEPVTPEPEPGPCPDECIDTRSGTWCWNPAAMAIISQALRRCGVINDEETPTQAMYDATLMTLNGVTKELETSGIHVWTEEEAILFLQQGQNRYLLGGCEDDAAHCCDAYAYLLQTLAAPALQNATTIQLTDATGFIDGFHVGLFLDNGETFWTKQVGAPSGNIITIADAVPSNIPQGNWVFGYETNITRPLKVPRARLHYFQGSRDTPIQTISRQEYQDLPNKENPGLVTQFFYAPKLRQGELYAWQNPFMYGLNNATALRITWYRPIQNWDDLTNTADFPQEWINPLSWILAEEIGPEYDVPADRWGIISAKATKARERAEDWDRESEDVQFGFGFDNPYQGRR